MKLSKKGIISVLVVAVVVGGIGLSFKDKLATTMGRGTPVAPVVQVHTASKSSISSQISAVGTVEANETERVYAKINATVDNVIAEVGDQVKKGDLLLVFDKDTKARLERDLEKLNLQLASANLVLSDLTTEAGKQEILQAQTSLVQVQKAEKDTEDAIRTQEISIGQIERELDSTIKMLGKQKELLDAGIITQKEYDDTSDGVKAIEDKLKAAKIQLETTKSSMVTVVAQKENAEYALDMALNKVVDKNKQQQIAAKQNEIKSIKVQIAAIKDEISKADIEVISPMDGIISEVLVVKGASVTQGIHMVTIMDISSLKVNTEVSTFNAPQVSLGQEAIIKQDSVEAKEYKGVVVELAPAAIQKQSGTSTTTIVPVKVKVEDNETSLKPGFKVDVKIKTASKDSVITLPILSIMEDTDEDYKYVYVIKEDNTLEKRKVQELTVDNIYVEVSGVEEGEKIVADPTESLAEGMLISTLESGDGK